MLLFNYPPPPFVFHTFNLVLKTLPKSQSKVQQLLGSLGN